MALASVLYVLLQFYAYNSGEGLSMHSDCCSQCTHALLFGLLGCFPKASICSLGVILSYQICSFKVFNLLKMKNKIRIVKKKMYVWLFDALFQIASLVVKKIFFQNPC